MGGYTTPKDEMNGWMFAMITLLIGFGLSGMILAIIAGV
jgi:hypothetical protein